MPRTHGALSRSAPAKSHARSRIWQSMRVLRVFDIPALAATAEAGLANVSTYVSSLVRAGVVAQQQERQSGVKGGHAVYRLVRDLGPHAPRLRKDGVWDPNKQQRLETSSDE
ncbi:MAG: hypothetical protein ACLFTX_06545 [Thiohalospira sp.]